MAPKKRSDVPASKVVSPSRSQATGERRAAAANRASPPPPLEKDAPGGAGGSTRSGEVGDVEKSMGGNTNRDPSVGEKSADARAGKGQQGAKSKSGTFLWDDAQARHDALVTAKALIQFPPNTDNPKVYQEWRSRVEELLHFADGGPRCEPVRAPTVDSPGAKGAEAQEPFPGKAP